jgi:hypothetical protein
MVGYAYLCERVEMRDFSAEKEAVCNAVGCPWTSDDPLVAHTQGGEDGTCSRSHL